MPFYTANTYAFATLGTNPYSGAGRLIGIYGNNNRPCHILLCTFTCDAPVSALVQMEFTLQKRLIKQVDNGSNGITGVALDSNSPPTNTVVRLYTANPTGGSPVLSISNIRTVAPLQSSSQNSHQYVLWRDYGNGLPLMLNNANEALSIGLNAALASQYPALSFNIVVREV